MFRAVAPALLLLVACEATPGRNPVYPDAERIYDADPVDAPAPSDTGIDAGFAESGVALPDTGRPPEFPFSGVYSYLGGADKLFAREVRGRLSIVIGQSPYVYLGTIDAAGTVDLRSPLLERSGCGSATIRGAYERTSAALFLVHESCTLQGGAINAQVRGGFDGDFALPFSGIYEVTATMNPNEDPQGCYQGLPQVTGLLWGVGVLTGNNAVVLYTAHDVIAAQSLYIGAGDPSGRTFSAVQETLLNQPRLQVSARGQLIQTTAREIPTIVGQRDVFDPLRQCTFRMQFQGTQLAAP